MDHGYLEITEYDKPENYRVSGEHNKLFINNITDLVNEYVCSDSTGELEFLAYVSKKEDNHYVLSRLDRDYAFREEKEFDIYHIDTTDHPDLAAELDKLCNLSEHHALEIESYKKIYEQVDFGALEYSAYLDYAKKYKKHAHKVVAMTALGSLSFIAMFFGIGLSLGSATTPLLIIPGLLVMIGSAPLAAIGIANISDKIFSNALLQLFKIAAFSSDARKYLRKHQKGKPIKKKIEKSKVENVKEKKEEKVDSVLLKKEVYKDPIINNMNKFKLLAENLNPDNKKIIFGKLEFLLDDYLAKKKVLNGKELKGLTLEDEESKLKQEIFDKLSELELEMNMLLKQEKANRELDHDASKMKKAMAESLGGVAVLSESDTRKR